MQPNSRFYTGSGIYRPVHLEIDEAIHFVPDSVVVTTLEASEESAKLLIEATVRNTTDHEQTVRLVLTGHTRNWPPELIIKPQETKLVVPAGSERTCSIPVTVEKPALWSPDSPARHIISLSAFVGDSQVDSAGVITGIRTVRVSAERGFELNGKRIILNGGNVHHDHGPLGAAAFDDAERHKVRMLKKAGYNAVRTSHNPPSAAFLYACDDWGLLVINEAFDGWARAKIPKDYSLHFNAQWRDDLTALVRRDRNHPSVVMWSIGNEVYERGNAEGVRIARELSDHIRTLDRTRPITIGLNSLGKNGDWSRLDAMFAPVEVAGYNYELGRHADDHVRRPERVIVASESYQNEVFANWRIARDHPYVIGDFVWSAQDYLGEAGIGRVFPPDEKPFPHWEGTHYPWHGAACGDIDLIGTRKPISHYRSIVWDTGEKLYAAVLTPTPDGRPWNLTQWSIPPAQASWTWAGHEGKPLTVEVYSRHPSVRLYLGDTLLGEKPTTELEEFKASFAVTYVPGVLRAVGVRDGKEVETFKLETAGPVVALRLTPHEGFIDIPPSIIGFNIERIIIEAVDAHGRVNPQADLPVKLHMTGPGELLAFGSGDLTATEPYNADLRRLHQGRALVVIRTSEQAGKIAVNARSEGADPIKGRAVFESFDTLLDRQLSCPPIFSDHMVLQRDKPVTISGEASGPSTR